MAIVREGFPATSGPMEPAELPLLRATCRAAAMMAAPNLGETDLLEGRDARSLSLERRTCRGPILSCDGEDPPEDEMIGRKAGNDSTLRRLEATLFFRLKAGFRVLADANVATVGEGAAENEGRDAGWCRL